MPSNASSHRLLNLDQYDFILVNFSGGKDSLACLIHVLELGAEKNKIELWHQCVDGDPASDGGLMDWPVTHAYCRAAAAALG